MPRRYSMVKRAADSDATRTHLLDSVVAVATTDGLEALTMQSVAAHADVAVRTVYNHFPSRHELVAAALARLADQTRATVRAIEVADRPAREQLLAFVDGYLRSYEEQGDAIRLLMTAADDPAVAPVVAEVRSWRRQQLRRMAHGAREEGTLAIPVAEATSVGYLATSYAGWATLVHDAGLPPATARATVRTIVDRTLFSNDGT
jgi:TetR/AcrR family transcriptional regulator, cholesterol catabolism regulator